MGKIKIALVDDEPETLSKLSSFCRIYGAEHFMEFEISAFSSGEAFLKHIFENDEFFPIVFMDVYMRGISGIDTARRLREKDMSGILIFLTSSADHMPDAFSCHAFEYVIKPFSGERIFQVLDDAYRILPDADRYIELVSERRKRKLSCAEICFVVTAAHYLDIKMTDGTSVRSRMKMSDFLNLIGGDSRFILVNKGVLINADHIANIQENACILDNGQRFSIRIRNAAEIKKEICEYNFGMIRRKQRYGKEQA